MKTKKNNYIVLFDIKQKSGKQELGRVFVPTRDNARTVASMLKLPTIASDKACYSNVIIAKIIK